nr:MAG TPA: hypothetical protein [Caudoviricetes sp.]
MTKCTNIKCYYCVYLNLILVQLLDIIERDRKE